MNGPYRVIHFLNQYFGQIGGEEKAGVGIYVKEGPVGPGKLLEGFLSNQGKVIATIICGDNFFNENVNSALERIFQIISDDEVNAFIAGPAFSAGRYGQACGAVCEMVQGKLKIPVVTAMYKENSGVEMFRRAVYIINGGKNSRSMSEDLSRMVHLLLKLLRGERIGNPEEEGYFPRGIIRNELRSKPAADRAIEMLIKKIRGEPFITELSKPVFRRVKPAKRIEDLSKSLIALVTDGGLVPKGNPDKIKSVQATTFGCYPIENREGLSKNDFEVNHGGYDLRFVAEDPHRILPVDVLLDLEREGMIGKLYENFFSTAGVGVAMESARGMGQHIARRLQKDGVNGVILTST
jgi:glycine reductase